MKSFVPGFANDVFISYSHIDDQAVGNTGWVTNFAARLRIQLSVVLGRDAAVWSDTRLKPADVFTRELEERLRATAVLVAIMSPSYVQSSWCDWELKGFLRSTRKVDLTVANKSRAIKVIKRPLEHDTLHEHVLADVNSVAFFEVGRDGLSYELTPDTRAYIEALTGVAANISKI